MKHENRNPFTRQQWEALDGDARKAVDAVCVLLKEHDLTTGALTTVEISQALNLLRPTGDGCVPGEEIDDDLATAVRKKFHAVYYAGLQMAEAALKDMGKAMPLHFDFYLLIDTDTVDFTHVAVIDRNLPRQYLHEWKKAWKFRFDSLQAIADKVLAVRNGLVNAVLRKDEIKVVVKDGMVVSVSHPPHIAVTVIDYDIEAVDRERLQISPIDGEACLITQFNQ